MSVKRSLRVAEMSGYEVGRVDSDHRQIRVRIVSDQVSLVLAAIQDGHFDSLDVMNNVTVSQNKAIRSEDET